jgi:Mg2+-importing ATPase
MGDGIIDVLAIKAAHVGIVVQGCSDIAREAADIILLRKSLRSVIDGIRHGRTAVINTKKYVTATLTSGIGGFFTLAISSLFVDFLPLQPVQILLLNFLSDFPMLALSGDNVDDDELTTSARFDMPWLLLLVMVFGSITAMFLLLLFFMFVRQPQAVLQTNWFIATMLTELVLIFSIRTKKPFWRAHPPAGLLLLFSLIVAGALIIIPTTTFGQHFFGFVEPSIDLLKIVLVVTFFYFIAIELAKLLLYRFRARITKITVALFS